MWSKTLGERVSISPFYYEIHKVIYFILEGFLTLFFCLNKFVILTIIIMMYCIMVKDENYKWHPVTSRGSNVLFLTEEEAEKYADFYKKFHPEINEYFVAVNKSKQENTNRYDYDDD